MGDRARTTLATAPMYFLSSPGHRGETGHTVSPTCIRLSTQLSGMVFTTKLLIFLQDMYLLLDNENVDTNDCVIFSR